ncbi:histone-lysine N-methyltransferase CLF isoform X2 [Lolium perenne]|uniref:histone-lysine N-methyltransferase CLF isoform X2 n=1 Tax=Lolium perenne TaxID=4522 RepID=UPI0021F588DD|nr:histone-lysine N-methyltransferase CLF-like isoform X2 [Lolium perenne]
MGQRGSRKPRSSAVLADPQYVLGVIESLKTKVIEDRFTCSKKKIEENRSKLTTVTRNTSNTSEVWQRNTSKGTDLVSNLLTSRQDDALCSMHSLGVSPAEEDIVSYEKQTPDATSTVLGGNPDALITPIKLPEVLRLPCYTTWTLLHRNQQTAEDQSVFGRQMIYYDSNCGEALVCSDEEGKHEFKGFEDYIIRMTIEGCGESNAVLETLAQHINRAADDIKARYEILHGEKTEGSVKEMSKLNANVEDVYRDKDLDAALDSFDNLFCRRCLVFDCSLHGCSQDLLFPTEKQSPWNSMDDNGLPCGIHCYKLASKLDSTTTIDRHMTIDTETTCLSDHTRKQLASNKKKQGENSSTQRVASESNDSEVHPTSNKSPQQISPKDRIKKRTKSGGCPWPRKLRSRTLNGHKDSVASPQQIYPSTRGTQKKDAPQMENTALAEDHNDSTEGKNTEHSATYGHDSLQKEESADGNICRQEDNGRSWKVIEKGLLVKGLEIFGRNSCLIARNLLGGMKTCSDIFQYMKYTDNSSASGVLNGLDSLADGHIEEHELRVRSRFFRRRGKIRRLKHTSKSAGYHLIRKRIAERNGQLYQQYNPCGCQSACGKECPCLKNGTRCEKYCGCPKMCNNRFRGCHCAKGQCRSRQCPCFASDRECDPDVCRNCWVGCGDGTLGFPKERGDNYECRNMKVLLKQQQRILLGRSDVSGWGAFLKNAVGKDEYLGEYTGELISHTEADSRGTIYDLENSSFLFNLNNEFVLDARRMGNKLKFANHSHDPNCYAKVMFVAGDHRVGIFAKERLGVGEEIFYDYHYKPEETPVWALKPDAPGAKDPGQRSCRRGKKPGAPGVKDPGQASSARAKKPDAPGAEDPGQPSCAQAKMPAL